MCLRLKRNFTIADARSWRVPVIGPAKTPARLGDTHHLTRAILSLHRRFLILDAGGDRGYRLTGAAPE